MPFLPYFSRETSLKWIPKWQTSRANVISSLKTLNKIPRTRAYSALENGRLDALELVALFLLKTETCDAKNSFINRLVFKYELAKN